jgi:ABC-type sulfate/molybdate transport systems ATPase subunit
VRDVRRRVQDVRRRVRDAARDAGTTVLHVTHDLAEARLLGDDVVLLDAGRVIQRGGRSRLTPISRV